MKTLLLSLSMALLAVATADESPESVALIPISKIQAPAKLIYSVDAVTKIAVFPDHSEHEMTATFQVHQGRPETLTLGLAGDGEIVSVEGDGLKTWSVRRDADGSRFLDLKPQPLVEGQVPLENYVYRISARKDFDSANAASIQALIAARGPAVGFSAITEIRSEGDAVAKVIEANGMQSLQGGEGVQRLNGSGRLVIHVGRKGAAPAPVELSGASLTGSPSSDGGSISFVLRGNLDVAEAGRAVDVLRDGALSQAAAGEGWHARLREEDGGGYVTELVGDRNGSFPIEMHFDVSIVRKGDWKTVSFESPAGVIVPVVLKSLGGEISFDRGKTVVPEEQGADWTGFMPGSGKAEFAWKDSRAEEKGALFFTSSELSEIRVGAGLVRRRSAFSFRVLQGQLDSLPLEVSGAGEILAVRGAQVIGWSVREEGVKRMLDIRLSRPVSTEAQMKSTLRRL